MAMGKEATTRQHIKQPPMMCKLCSGYCVNRRERRNGESLKIIERLRKERSRGVMGFWGIIAEEERTASRLNNNNNKQQSPFNNDISIILNASSHDFDVDISTVNFSTSQSHHTTKRC